MEKQQLQQILSSKYDRKDWIILLNTVFKSGRVFSNPQKAQLPNADKWKEAWELGSFKTHDGEEITVFEIEVADTILLDKNRITLRNLLLKYYSQTDGIFAVFKQNDRWRFSFISQIREYDEENNEW